MSIAILENVSICCLRASLVAWTVKNLCAMQKTQVRPLGWEDPLEGVAIHSSILAWRILWIEKLVDYSPWGHKELDITEQLSLSLSVDWG